MTLNELTEFLPILTAGALAIGLILFFLALRLFRRSRKGSIWQNRRQAGQRGFRVMMLSIGCLGISAMLCVTTLVFNSLEEDENDDDPNTPEAFVTEATTESVSPEIPAFTETATATSTTEVIITELPTEPAIALEATATETLDPISSPNGANDSSATASSTTEPSSTATLQPTDTPTQTATVAPSASATITPSPSPTDAPTATATITPFPTLSVNITPPAPRATPDDDLSLRIAAISDGLTADFQPTRPAESFGVGVRRIYFFIRFRDMESGVLWRRALFKDGEFLDGGSYLWGTQAEGESYFFFGRGDGFESGEYEIRIYIGDAADPLTTENFTVR